MKKFKTIPQLKSGLICALIFTGSAYTSSCLAQPTEAIAPETVPRILEVDRLGSTPYKTLASAAQIAREGDTIRVKPNSGPYREVLRIKASGTEKSPIIFDGGNNIVTAYEPITEWEEKDGVVSYRIKTFPCVIAYKGERLVQDAATKQFTKYADLNEAKDTLTLRAGVEKTGWEISTRDVAVQINNASYHIYRNVRASGGTNDGFGLHGVGVGLLFENIEAFQNLDEGFSTHDSIQTVVRGAKFWGNDNGIANSYVSKDVVSSTFEDTDVYDNLGFGLTLHDCAGKLKNVRIWNNGLRQLRFNSANVDCENVVVYTPQHTQRQLVSYMDSRDTVRMFAYSAGETIITGTEPIVKTESAPPLKVGQK